MSTISGMNIVVQQVETARDIQTQKNATADAKQLQAAQIDQEEKLPTQKVQESDESEKAKLHRHRHGEKENQNHPKPKPKKKRSDNPPKETRSTSGRLLDTIA
jgi:hypothetical protein